MRRSSALRAFSLLITIGLAACGDAKDGTFVRLKFSGTVSTEAPIQSIAVDLLLAGTPASTIFQAAAGRDIKLPTDSVLEIGNGAGALTVTAKAFSATGALLGTGTGAGKVVRNETAEIDVIFGGFARDAGTDGPVGIDGPVPLDGAIDLGNRDQQGERSWEVQPLDGVTPDASIDVASEDVSTDDDDAPVDVPVTGGASGSDAAGTAGVSGSGGTDSGTGDAGSGTGGIAGSTGGQAGTGGTATGGSTGGTATSGSTGRYQLTVAPPSIDFGVVVPGTTAPTRTLLITNVGDASTPPLVLTINDVDKVFPLVLNGCDNAVLTPGGSCEVSYGFSPGTTGGRSADGLVAPAGDTGAKFQLTGTGAGGAATLTLSPSDRQLGLVNLGSPVTVTYTLTNGGDTSAGTITTTITGPATFSFANNTCEGLVLAARSQCTFDVIFAPTAFGPTSATINTQSSTGLIASATLSAIAQDFVQLTIAFTGRGAGSVTGGPQACPSGAACTFSIARSDPNAIPQFVLTASPDSLSLFSGWSGACTNATGTCAVGMDGSRSVTVAFDQRMVTVNVTVVGLAGHTGTVYTKDGSIKCNGTCPGLQVPATNALTMIAEPDTGSTFAAWTVAPTACKKIVPDCTYPLLNGPLNIVATFGPQAYMFVSSTTFIPGKLDGFAGADRICAELAAKASLPGKYAAWLSTDDTTAPAYRRVGEGGWIRTDGRPFAHDLKTLVDPLMVLYPPRVDEYGTDLGSVRIPVVTGSSANGTPIGNSHCKDYTTTEGNVVIGDAAGGSTAWTHWTEDPLGCNKEQHLYCFRTDLSAYLDPPKPPVEPRIAFSTTTPFIVKGGPGAATELCQLEAEKAGLDPRSFVAFLASKSYGPALKLVNLNGPPWARPDGVLIVNQAGDLERGRLLAPIDVAALPVNGMPAYNAGPVWTGAEAPTLDPSGDCGDWGLNPVIGSGLAGDQTTSATPFWFTGEKLPCTNETTRIMCFQK